MPKNAIAAFDGFSGPSAAPSAGGCASSPSFRSSGSRVQRRSQRRRSPCSSARSASARSRSRGQQSHHQSGRSNRKGGGTPLSHSGTSGQAGIEGESTQKDGAVSAEQADPPCPSAVAPKLGEPLWSFRRFVISKSAAEVDAAGPEKLVEQYKAYNAEHQKDSMHRYWTAHSNHGLLRDRFHETNQRRAADWKLGRLRQASANFLKQLDDGYFQKLSLCAPTSLRSESSAAWPDLSFAELTEDAGLSCFPLDACDAKTLVLDSVPPDVSVWDVHDELAAQPGFEDAVLVPASRLRRTGYVLFKSEADSRAAAQSLAAGLSIGGAHLAVRQAASEVTERLLVAPAASASEADADLAGEVILALDAAAGIAKEESEKAMKAMCASAGDAVERLLDLRVVYLRHVHLCCFYSGTCCASTWELLRQCGRACMREAAASEGAGENAAWAQQRKERLQKVLRSAQDKALAAANSKQPSLEEEPLRSRWLARCSEMTMQVGEGRFRCTSCNKCFRAEEFVRKHIYKLHSEVMRELLEEVSQARMKEAFFADPSMPCEVQWVGASRCAGVQDSLKEHRRR